MTEHTQPCRACEAEKRLAALIPRLGPRANRVPRRPTAADGAALGSVSTRLSIISARLGGKDRAVPDGQAVLPEEET